MEEELVELLVKMAEIIVYQRYQIFSYSINIISKKLIFSYFFKFAFKSISFQYLSGSVPQCTILIENKP